MIRSLTRVEDIEFIHYDPGLYMMAELRKEEDTFFVRRGSVNWLKDEFVQSLIDNHEPDIIVTLAGGLSPTIAMMEKIRKCTKCVLILINLSDPDDFFKRGIKFASHFYLVTTNAMESVSI